MLLVFADKMSAQVYTTQGKDFWLAFILNHEGTNNYSITASAQRSCFVTISSPNSGWSQTFAVGANQAVKFDIPPTHAFQQGSCITSTKGLHITATDTVTVSANNRTDDNAVSTKSSDATTLIATPSLGSHYYIQNYPIVNVSNNNAKSTFNVLATEDSTIVLIKFNGNTSGSLHAGDSTTIVLMQGQVYQVESEITSSDFSGTEVISKNCKPIAVFSGNSMATIPSGSNVAFDHIYQQMVPTYCADTDWVLVAAQGFAHSDFTLHDYVRVTATQDNTQIAKDGIPLATINRGQTYEFDITTAAHITTSHPALLYQYMASRHVSQAGADKGDAAMFAPNSVNMKAKDVIFRTDTVISRGTTGDYYVNLVVPTTETSLMSLDGSSISGFANLNGTGYSYVRKRITHGTHRVITTGSGFIGSCYSEGENWEGVYKTLGGTARIIPQTIGDTIDTAVCLSSFVFNGESYPVPGVYSVGGNCGNGGTLLRLSSLDSTITMPACDTMVCGNIFEWRDSSYTHTGLYLDTVHHESGCDSVFQLKLDLQPNVEFFAKVSACKPYATFNDSIYYEDGEYVLRYPIAEGCDTLIHLNVTLHPDYDTLYLVEITNTESYTWINGTTYTDNTYAELTSHNQYGCDSIHRLVLHVLCGDTPPDKPSTLVPNIWVPNTFTPNADINQHFGIKSKNVDRMTVSIYRRWGERVCTFDGLTEQWDGTKNGIPCPEEAYVYIIHYHIQNSNEKPEPLVGTVLLIR